MLKKSIILNKKNKILTNEHASKGVSCTLMALAIPLVKHLLNNVKLFIKWTIHHTQNVCSFTWYYFSFNLWSHENLRGHLNLFKIYALHYYITDRAKLRQEHIYTVKAASLVCFVTIFVNTALRSCAEWNVIKYMYIVWRLWLHCVNYLHFRISCSAVTSIEIVNANCRSTF